MYNVVMIEDSFHLGIKAIIRNKQGEILLLKTNPAKLRGYAGDPYWDIPGGRIHKESSVEETLKRELGEETGITEIMSMEPFTMVLSTMRIPTDNGSVGLILASYLCEIGNSPEIKISDEHIEAKWFAPKEAAKLLEFKYPKEFVEKLAEI